MQRGRIYSQQNSKSDKIVKSILKTTNNNNNKILNDNSANETQVQSLDEQIKIKKEEINECAEISQKLAAQQKFLKDQVQELGQIIKNKKKQFEEEERDRIENHKKQLNQIQLQIPIQTEDQKKQRLRELNQEFDSLEKYGQILVKDLKFARQENQLYSDDFNKQIIHLLTQIDDSQKEIKIIQKKISFQKNQSKTKEKKLCDLESGKDDATIINNLTIEYLQINEKIKKIELSTQKQQDIYIQGEQFIKNYQLLIRDLFTHNKLTEFEDQYHKIQYDYQQKNSNFYNSELQHHIQEKKKSPQQKIIQKSNIQNKQLNINDIRNMKQEEFNSLSVNENNYFLLLKFNIDLQESLRIKNKKADYDITNLDVNLNDLKMEKSNFIAQIQQLEREKYNLLLLYNNLETKLQHLLNTRQPSQNDTSLINGQQIEKNITKQEQIQSKLEKLKKKQEQIQQPFNLSQNKQQLNQQIVTMTDKLTDTKNRVSLREWDGYLDDTEICDDVNVVGQYSTDHRLYKISITHQEWIIYSVIVTYLKNDKKTLIHGNWQVKHQQKEIDKQITTSILNLGTNDQIKEISIIKKNGFIQWLEIITKNNQILKVGREDKENDKKTFRIHNNYSIITLFVGYANLPQGGLGLSLFGWEIARKSKQEEQNLKDQNQGKQKEKITRHNNQQNQIQIKQSS